MIHKVPGPRGEVLGNSYGITENGSPQRISQRMRDLKANSLSETDPLRPDVPLL